jgi:hypothetical protein
MSFSEVHSAGRCTSRPLGPMDAVAPGSFTRSGSGTTNTRTLLVVLELRVIDDCLLAEDLVVVLIDF